ncbi:Wzz/FepE/Etk N-terminal domain-containing protein [Shewanella sp. FJAT-52076]|uniref:Wzz/FepE/Etk N-terminal domain-containing protein n=1 Tax=Shewanella sp. FJAT-52076 TaxID=2864202 RepID=UPI001C65B304|nr:Wzz/FepE/Etk N-terminal domain-containing protein [Shewanella sp. FJAT-52076]QYJ74040.1 LPS O-antigen length regulator [Shewanella sp. FJAT-52076]
MTYEEIQQLNTDKQVISFSRLARLVWLAKWYVVVITLIGSLATLIYAISLPNIYRANAIYLPKGAQDAGALSKLAGQFGGLASMAGISLGGAGEDKTDALLEYLQSRSFLQQFIDRHNLLVPLLAAEGWDPQAGKLIIDPSVYDETTQTWVRTPPPGMAVIPTSWEAYEPLLKLIRVSYQSKKGYVELSVSYYSPKMAADWLTWLVADLNAYWKQREHERNTTTIAFLTKQAEQSQFSELRAVFYQLIAEQTKSGLLAEISDEVMLESMAPVVVPEYKHSPSRALLCIVGAFLSGVLGVIVALIVSIRRENRA